MIFNYISLEYKLFQLLFVSFFVIITIRKLFFKRIIYVVLYYSLIFIVVFVAAIVGGSVQNADYERLEKFKMLEKTNQLQDAKLNPDKYDKALQMDLMQFATASAFETYIKGWDPSVDKAECVSVGLFFALLTEMSAICSIFLALIRKVVIRTIMARIRSQ